VKRLLSLPVQHSEPAPSWLPLERPARGAFLRLPGGPTVVEAGRLGTPLSCVPGPLSVRAATESLTLTVDVDDHEDQGWPVGSDLKWSVSKAKRLLRRSWHTPDGHLEGRQLWPWDTNPPHAEVMSSITWRKGGSRLWRAARFPRVNKNFYLFIYLFYLFFCLFFFGARIEPKASRMLGKRCTTELHPSPKNF
jgi:hypothetical protein